MCVLAIAWEAHPRWRLVVAANRDEFHDRPAEPLHRWADADLIAGRDVRAGGTWLGISAGRFAAVTNLRGFSGPDPARASRGALVENLATGCGDYGSVATALEGDFNPYNAIVVDATGAHFLSNRPQADAFALAPGFHAMSNGPLDPPWRKTVRLRDVIEAWLGTSGDPAMLLDGLRDPNPPAGDGDDPTAIFVDNPVYGTRCSTIVAIDRDGSGTIIERRFASDTAVTGETALAFAW